MSSHACPRVLYNHAKIWLGKPGESAVLKNFWLRLEALKSTILFNTKTSWALTCAKVFTYPRQSGSRGILFPPSSSFCLSFFKFWLLLQPPVVIPFKVPSTCWMTIRNCTYAAEMEYARLARKAWLIWYKRPGTREPTATVSSKHSQPEEQQNRAIMKVVVSFWFHFYSFE